MDAIWAFLKEPANRDVLTWIGGGLVVVVGGIWAVIKFMSGGGGGAGKPPPGRGGNTVTAINHSTAAGRDVVSGGTPSRKK